MTLAERLRDRIRREGPLTVAAWMDACLYDPNEGYYAKGPAIGGAGGDFYTSASFPLFAAAIARLAEAVARDVGAPAHVLEVGPGTGELARGLAEKLGGKGRVTLVEKSPAAREALAREGFRVHATLEELGPRAVKGLVIANEVVDAFPAHRLAIRGKEVREVYVDVDPKGAFVAREAALSKPALARFAKGIAPADPAEPVFLDVQPEAGAFVDRVATALDKGLIVLLDYGDTRANLAHDRPKGTLRAYRGHDVLDWLAPEPGTADLTADVDFEMLRERGAEKGMRVFGPVTQGEFLLDLGVADDYVKLAGEDPIEALKAKTLFLPGGMGERFRVIGLARGIEGKVAGFGATR